MRASTLRSLAIALAAALLMAVAVCWGPGSRPGPAPSPTELAVTAPDAASTPAASSSTAEATAPALPRTPVPAPAVTETPFVVSDQGGDAVATSTPFTLADLAATSTPISALLPPALPSITVQPAPTAKPAAAETPDPTASPGPTGVPSPTATPAPTTRMLPPTLPSGPQVVVGGAVFSVDVASTAEEKQQGLSGREGLGSMSGMLFLYESGRPYQFWMKGMLFAIDIVWIAPDCTVGDITYELQPPRAGAPDSEVLRASPSVEAAHVLEIAAGESRRLGLEIGDAVRFLDISAPAGDAC